MINHVCFSFDLQKSGGWVYQVYQRHRASDLGRLQQRGGQESEEPLSRVQSHRTWRGSGTRLGPRGAGMHRLWETSVPPMWLLHPCFGVAGEWYSLACILKSDLWNIVPHRLLFWFIYVPDFHRVGWWFNPISYTPIPRSVPMSRFLLALWCEEKVNTMLNHLLIDHFRNVLKLIDVSSANG